MIGPNGADVFALTLRPVAYVEEGTDSEISLVGPGGRTRFEALLPRTPLDTFGSRRAALLPRLRWEPVDGQHILYACTEIAAQEMAEGRLTEAQRRRHFTFRVATMVVYDDERFYVEESSRVNTSTTNAYVIQQWQKIYGRSKICGYIIDALPHMGVRMLSDEQVSYLVSPL